MHRHPLQPLRSEGDGVQLPARPARQRGSRRCRSAGVFDAYRAIEGLARTEY